MIDINELRRLAQSASHPTTKGRWIRLFGEHTVYDRTEDGCRGIPVVSTDKHPPSPFEAACLDFIAAANPSAISELLDRLEAAEKELESWRGLAQQLGNEVGALRFRLERRQDELNQLRANLESAEKERDALRARVEAMEKQEPVAQVGVHKTGGNAGIAWSARPLNEFDSLPPLCDGDKLYLAPGAQPAPSALAEAIIADMQAQHDSELITENDSGEALIRLDGAIAAVEDNFALAQPAPIIPEGWKLVPTAESRHPGIYKMLGALHTVDNTPGASEWESYAAFLAAAPEAKP